MNLKVTKENEIAIICLTGDLDGISSGKVTDDIMKILEDTANITIDMKDCAYVSSAGLRTLLTVGKTVKIKGGKMCLTNLIPEVQEIMEMTGFSAIFQSFES